MATNTTRFEATLDTSKFIAGIKKLESGAKNAFNNIASFGEKVFFGFQGLKLAAEPLKNLVNASNELATSQRKLEAASKLTGTSLESLKATSDDIKNNFQLTTTQANEFVVSANKLAIASGDVSKSGEILNKLFDLAAAQGLTAEEALLRFDQAIKGIDEGTEALFSGKNPIDLYREYAASIGTTAGKLTLMQQQQAKVNEILKSGSKLQGEYNKFLDSAQGKQQQLANITEEFSAKLGNTVNTAISPLLDLGIKIFGLLSKLNPAITQIIAVVVALTTVVLKFGIALKSATGIIGIVITVLASLYFAYKNNLGGIKEYVDIGLEYLFAFFKTVRDIFKGLALIFNNSLLAIKKATNDILTEFLSGNFNVIDLIKKGYTEAIDAVVTNFDTAVSSIKNNFTVAKDNIDKIKSATNELKDSTDGLGKSFNKNKGYLQEINAEFTKLREKYKDSSSMDILKDANNFLKDRVDKFKSYRQELINEEGKWLAAALAPVITSVNEAEELRKKKEDADKAAAERDLERIAKIRDLVTNSAVSISQTIGTTLVESFKGGTDALKEGMRAILNTILDFLQAKAALAYANSIIEGSLGNILALFKFGAISAAIAAARAAVSSFAVGVENFGGGLAYVHSGELVQLPAGTNVYTKTETQRMFRQNNDMSETNGLLKELISLTKAKRTIVNGSQISEVVRKDNLRKM